MSLITKDQLKLSSQSIKQLLSLKTDKEEFNQFKNKFKNSQANWNENNSLSDNFISNRTHYVIPQNKLVRNDELIPNPEDLYIKISSDEKIINSILNGENYFISQETYPHKPASSFVTDNYILFTFYASPFDKYFKSNQTIFYDSEITVLLVLKDNTILNFNEYGNIGLDRGVYFNNSKKSSQKVVSFEWDEIIPIDTKYLKDMYGVKPKQEVFWNGKFPSPKNPYTLIEDDEYILQSIKNGANFIIKYNFSDISKTINTYQGDNIIIFSHENTIEEAMNNIHNSSAILTLEDNIDIPNLYNFKEKGLYFRYEAYYIEYTESLQWNEIKTINKKYFPKDLVNIQTYSTLSPMELLALPEGYYNLNEEIRITCWIDEDDEGNSIYTDQYLSGLFYKTNDYISFYDYGCLLYDLYLEEDQIYANQIGSLDGFGVLEAERIIGDEELNTEAKTITEAINEINSKTIPSDWNQNELTAPNLILNKPFGPTWTSLKITAIGDEYGALDFDYIEGIEDIAKKGNFIECQNQYYEITQSDIGTGGYWGISGDNFNMNGRSGQSPWGLYFDDQYFNEGEEYSFSILAFKENPNPVTIVKNMGDGTSSHTAYEIHSASHNGSVILFQKGDQIYQLDYAEVDPTPSAAFYRYSGNGVVGRIVINDNQIEYVTDILATEEYVDSLIPTNEQALELAAEMGLIEPAMNNGYIFTDENGVIYTI